MSRAERVRRGVVTGVLAGWLATTVLCQHPARALHGPRRHDPLGILIPTWRFFAPEPGRHDHLLACRTIGPDGTEGPWETAAGMAERRAVQALWFPGRRREKALLDACAAVAAGRGVRDGDVTTAPAYRVLRECAMRVARERHPDAVAIRFGVLRTGGRDAGEPPRWLFRSERTSL